MWVAECPAILGCIDQGRTRDEAAENIEDAIKGCLEVRAELGMSLMVETRVIEVATRCGRCFEHARNHDEWG